MALLSRIRRLTSSFTSSHRAKSRRPARRHGRLEPLEDRRMLATIQWVNRGVSDDFDNYGANEVLAREIVDRAIDDWEEVIQDFNYTDGTNTFEVNFNAYDNDGVCGAASITSVDDFGRPMSADISLCGGTSDWYFDPLIGTNALPDDSEFSEFITPFAADRDVNDNRIDLYTVALHELSHVLGIASGSGLKIDDYLSGPLMDDPVNPSAPGDPGNHLYALNIDGGPVEATFTDAGSGDVDNLFPAHLYEGPSTAATDALGLPTHPNNLSNDGRTWNANREVRRLIPDFNVELLEMVYGYDVQMPSSLNTFYANHNLATGELTVQGEEGTYDDQIELDEVANDVRVRVNGTSERILAAAISSMEVRGQSGEDFIEINETPIGKPVEVFGGSHDDVLVLANYGNLTSIDGDVTFHGSSGNDVLNVQDLGNSNDRNYFVSDSSITPSGLGFSINYSPSVDRIFFNGTDGDNTFFIDSIHPSVNTSILGHDGDDTFIVGGSGIIQTLDGIQGPLTMSGNNGTDEVRFRDGSHIGSETYRLFDSSFQRADLPLSMNYHSMESVDIEAGQGNDTIEINSIDDATTVNGGSGSDEFIVGDGDIDTNITADLNILGGLALGPNDHLILDDVDDANPDTYWLESDSFNKFNFPPSLTYDGSINAVTLNANSDHNIINVDSAAADVQMTLNGMNGDDRFAVGDGDIDTNVDGNIVVNGGAGENELRLLDLNDQFGDDTYTLTDTTFGKSDFGGTLQYSDIHFVWLWANEFDNTFEIDSTPANALVRIDGDNGADQFNVNAPPASPIEVNGEAPNTSPGDGLHVKGAPTSVGVYKPDAAIFGDGVVTVDGVDITFTGLEPVTVDTFAEFSIITPNGSDDLRIDEFGSDQNVLTGTSDGVPFEELRFSDVDTFLVDMASNDFGTSDDVLTLSAGDLAADTGVQLVQVNAGTGTNEVRALSGSTNLTTSVGALEGVRTDVLVRFDNTFVNFPESQDLRSMTILSGRVLLGPNDGNTILKTRALDVNGGPGQTATLDLYDNGVIVDYADIDPSPYTELRDQIINARNENAPALWTGSGITSRLATVFPEEKAVGYAEASHLFGGGGGSFMGQNIAAGDDAVLIRTTQIGDANLNGIVDGIDFIVWNNNKFGPGDWAQGDFNYDGLVDGLDFIEWNNNKFTQFDQAAPIVSDSANTVAPMTRTSRADRANEVRPEPTSVHELIDETMALLGLA